MPASYHRYQKQVTSITNSQWVRGIYMVHYLWNTSRIRTGDEAVTAFIRNLGGQSSFFKVHDAFKTVFGKGSNDLFDEWKEHVIKTVTPHKETHTQLTSTGWNKDFITVVNDHEFIYVDSQMVKPKAAKSKTNASVVLYNTTTNTSTVLFSLKSVPQTFPQYNNNTYYYTQDAVSTNFDNTHDCTGVIQELLATDITTGKTTSIITDRFNAFHISNDNIYLFKQTDGGFGTDVHILNDERELTYLGHVPIRISEVKDFNKDWVVVAKEKNRAWGMYRIDCHTLNTSAVVNTPHAEIQLQIVDDDIIYSENIPKSISRVI